MDNRQPGLPVPKEETICSKLTSPIRWFCWQFTVCMNMDAVYEAQFSAQPIDFGRPDIAQIRTEVKQLLKAFKCTGTWLLSLASLYLLMAFVDWKKLTSENFDKLRDDAWDDEYTFEMYTYT